MLHPSKARSKKTIEFLLSTILARLKLGLPGPRLGYRIVLDGYTYAVGDSLKLVEFHLSAKVISLN